MWSEGGAEDFHSVDEFWEDRFLQFPGDPKSGPAKQELATNFSKPKGILGDSSSSKQEDPKFTMEGVLGAFVPFGGGQNLCPGRNYAKQEAICAIAIMLGNFELELIDEGKGRPEPDMKYFSIGVVPPRGKFAARIKTRKS